MLVPSLRENWGHAATKVNFPLRTKAEVCNIVQVATIEFQITPQGLRGAGLAAAALQTGGSLDFWEWSGEPEEEY